MENGYTLFSILNIQESSDKKSVDAAYDLYTKIKQEKDDIRLAWKILRDDNYRALYAKTKSLEDVYRAGFFDDKEDDDTRWLNEDPRLLVTPYQKIINRLPLLSEGDEGAVLVTTGSFSPLHQGHIDMLDQAKEYLESKGQKVLGGYIIPAHDSYVATKNKGQAGMGAQLRIHLAQVSIQDSEWLMVDGSEALCNPCDRNFTDVIRRIKKYLGYHFKNIRIKVYYVCGEDVSTFSFAFAGTGECICVGRNTTSSPIIDSSCIFINNSASSKSSSSSLVRAGEHSLLSKDAIDLYTSWLSQFNTIGEYATKNDFYYHVRYEGVLFYKRWLPSVPEANLNQVLSVFRKGLIKVLQQAFLDSIPPNTQVHVKVSPIYFDSQLRKLNALSLKEKTISMDQCYEGDYKLGVSRLFALSDGQFKGERLVNRPGLPPLPEQFLAIPDGEYYLIEDDIGSGQTMSLIKETIPDRIKMKDTILMNRFTSDTRPKEEFDIVDMRDFIFGASDGGLVTMLSNGSIVRSLYAYPYVNLVKRAKLPFFNTLKTSLHIWRLNYSFFSSLQHTVTLSEVSSSSSSLFLFLGFTQDSSVLDICKWHISFLEKMVEFEKVDYGIEFYHVYDDEGLISGGEKSLDVALERINKITEQKKSYCTTLLIDDYRSKNFLLEKEKRDSIHFGIIEEFHKLSKIYNVSIDFFTFESMMIKIAKKIVKRIPKNFIVKDYYKKKQSYVTMLKNQGFRIGLVELWEDDVKYSCALLSAAWILCRLGEENIPSNRLVSVRGKNFSAKKIMTILPKEYESTEDKAKVILLSAGYGHVLERIESIYY